MIRFRTIVRLGLAVFTASLVTPAWAERITVPSGEGNPQEFLDRAADGDIIVLQTGEHRGTIRITRRLTVEGEPGAVLIGPGTGSVVTVAAPEAIVRGLS